MDKGWKEILGDILILLIVLNIEMLVYYTIFIIWVPKPFYVVITFFTHIFLIFIAIIGPILHKYLKIDWSVFDPFNHFCSNCGKFKLGDILKDKQTKKYEFFCETCLIERSETKRGGE